VSWAGGGNLPPLLAAGTLLAARDHRVCVLTSSATRQPAIDAGFDVVGYRRSPDPNADTAFEQQAAEMMAIAAGPEIALDVSDVAAELRPALMIVDCMLPAGIAAGEATGIPTVSLVHFPTGSRERRCCAAAAPGRPIVLSSTAPAAASAWSPRETTSLPGNRPSCS
jgi:hypothetical protein